MNRKLKPCPKCKLRNEIELCILMFPKVYKKKFVRCFDCDYKTKRAFTVRGAKKYWNRRVTE